MNISTTSVFGLTLWHRSGTDVSRHAAAVDVCKMVAGHDLDLITGKVVQIGDDG